MPYSFKLLVHDITIQLYDPILISNPQLSVTIANYPKIIVVGKCPISNIKGTYDQQKAFGNGKSILLNLSQDKMTDILREQPLEIIFLNGQAILAGARINIEHFIPDIDQELKFKRGNFHLLDQFGKPYALADISISIHDPEKIPEILKEEREKQIQQVKLKQQQDYLQSLEKPSDPEPVPDEIVYNKNKKQQANTPKNNEQSNYEIKTPKSILNNDKQEQKKFPTRQETTKSIYSNQTSQKNQKRPSTATPKSQQIQNKQQTQQTTTNQPTQKQKSQRNSTQKVAFQPPVSKAQENQQKVVQQKKNPNSVFIPEPEEVKDIPITEFVNTLYCPPPMFLDKKVYVHKIYNAPEEQVEKFIKPAKVFSIGVQTDAYYPPFQEHTSPILIQQDLTPKERIQTQTVVSDNYQEDFESFVQSQSQMGASSQIKQSKTPRAMVQSNRRTTSIQEAVDEDVISDIYSEDFEQISQSQTFKRSLSKKDDISDSYIPDFESISQSYQQFRKK